MTGSRGSVGERAMGGGAVRRAARRMAREGEPQPRCPGSPAARLPLADLWRGEPPGTLPALELVEGSSEWEWVACFVDGGDVVGLAGPFAQVSADALAHAQAFERTARARFRSITVRRVAH